jgi:hypothetical protein
VLRDRLDPHSVQRLARGLPGTRSLDHQPRDGGARRLLLTPILNHRDAADEFLVVKHWISRDASEAYHLSSVHDGFRDRVTALLASHSGTREYLAVRL